MRCGAKKWSIIGAVTAVALGVSMGMNQQAEEAALGWGWPAAQAQTSPSQGGLPAVSEVFDAQKGKVVAIKAQKAQQARGPFGFGGPRSATGQGSGFVVDADGFVLTNHHVVEGADEITVAMASGEEYPAKLIGSDPKTDLALLKIDAKRRLDAVALGDSSDLRVGQWVVAIGNPFGLDYSVTAGIISAKGRNIGQGPYDDFLQTDASINPGNSGGPLFNLDGEVVGVNTAIIRGGQGIGFAVPVDMVKNIVPQLKEQGYVTRGYIGAMLQELSEAMAASYGLPPRSGVLIGSVEEGGPAAQAGLRAGDIVTEFGGEPVREVQDLMVAVARTRPESTRAMVVIRDGDEERVEVRLAERPDAAQPQVRPARLDDESPNQLGVRVSDVPAQMAARLGGETGVLVRGVLPGSPAARALRPGDVIVEVGAVDISSVEEFARIVRAHAPGEPMRMRVLREGRGFFVAVRLGE